jgi:hypothetical protein
MLRSIECYNGHDCYRRYNMFLRDAAMSATRATTVTRLFRQHREMGGLAKCHRGHEYHDCADAQLVVLRTLSNRCTVLLELPVPRVLRRLRDHRGYHRYNSHDGYVAPTAMSAIVARTVEKNLQGGSI